MSVDEKKIKTLCELKKEKEENIREIEENLRHV
jgi:hypothetical protein